MNYNQILSYFVLGNFKRPMKQIMTLFWLLGALGAQAQTSSDTTSTVGTLSAKIEALEAKTSGWEKMLQRLPAISGFVQTGYQWSEASSSFFIKRVRLGLSGELGKKFDYRLQIEFCSPKVVDVYVQYKAFTQLNLRVGEYTLPFSIENIDYPPLKQEFVDYPLVVQKLVGINDVSGVASAGRDVGLMAWGGFIQRDGYCILNYDVAILNGEGINLKDANKSKDVVGRLSLKPVAGLQITGSYYWGETGDNYRKRIRYGAGVCYDRSRVLVRGEYIGGTTGIAGANNGPVADIDSEGWYAQAGFRATPSLMPLVRYDTFVDNCARRVETRQTNYTAGLVWQPVKYLRCQLNYTYEDYGRAPDRNVVAAMVTGIF